MNIELYNMNGGHSLVGVGNAQGNFSNLNEEDLQQYHAASQLQRANLDVDLNGAYYYNVIYMEAQQGCMCSRHALKMLLHPHVPLHSSMWGEIERNPSLQPDVGRFWNNRSTTFLLDAMGILLPRAKLELNEAIMAFKLRQEGRSCGPSSRGRSLRYIR